MFVGGEQEAPSCMRELSQQMEFDSLDREEIINTRLFLDRMRAVLLNHCFFHRIVSKCCVGSGGAHEGFRSLLCSMDLLVRGLLL